MQIYRLFALSAIMLSILVFCVIQSSAVPPDPRVYGQKSGTGIYSADVSMPMLTESTTGRTDGSTAGDHEVVVILVEFQDVDHDPAHDSAYFDDLLFSKSNPYSMYSYYHEVSYGQLLLSGNITSWYRSSFCLSYYGADGEKLDRLNGPVYELAREAIQLADSSGFDFSQYDMDDDGYVDHIIIVHAGPGQETGGGAYGTDSIWSHHWNLWPEEQVDDVKASHYSMVSEFSPVGTLAHEFGHDLGLPELYDTDWSSQGIGVWGIMGYGAWLMDGEVPSHFCAWSKVFLGWVQPREVIADERDLVMNCVEQGNLETIIKIPLTPDEYFLLENRQKAGFDEHLPADGLLIWHIDDSVGKVVYNNVNKDEDHKRVDLEEADGRDDLDRGANSGDLKDPYYLGNSSEFGPSTVPDSGLYSGKDSDVRITNISSSGATMTLDILPGSNTAPVAVQDMNINLASGWNLISLCLEPAYGDCGSVLSSVAGEYDSIWTYDAATMQWQRHVVDGPNPLNDLGEMNACAGYWIRMRQAGTLSFQGAKSTMPISLKAGWNLVGYNSHIPIPVEECISMFGGRCISIWTYNSEAQKWLRFDVRAPAFLNTLGYLEPGRAYWIETTEDFVWKIASN